MWRQRQQLLQMVTGRTLQEFLRCWAQKFGKSNGEAPDGSKESLQIQCPLSCGSCVPHSCSAREANQARDVRGDLKTTRCAWQFSMWTLLFRQDFCTTKVEHADEACSTVEFRKICHERTSLATQHTVTCFPGKWWDALCLDCLHHFLATGAAGSIQGTIWHHLPRSGPIDVFFLHEHEESSELSSLAPETLLGVVPQLWFFLVHLVCWMIRWRIHRYFSWLCGENLSHQTAIVPGVIKPHGAFTVNTYEDHVFLFRDAGPAQLEEVWDLPCHPCMFFKGQFHGSMLVIPWIVWVFMCQSLPIFFQVFLRVEPALCHDPATRSIHRRNGCHSGHGADVQSSNRPLAGRGLHESHGRVRSLAFRPTTPSASNMGWTNRTWCGLYTVSYTHSLHYMIFSNWHLLPYIVFSSQVDLPQEDWEGSCAAWAQDNQCVQNPGFMWLDRATLPSLNLLKRNCGFTTSPGQLWFIVPSSLGWLGMWLIFVNGFKPPIRCG